MQREIIRIDEELCNGCGNCVTGCAEGALEVIDGKAKLVRDMYCDGLGACLGHCPTGALTVITREAEGFDEEAAMARVRSMREPVPASAANLGHGCPGEALADLRGASASSGGRCPGTGVATFRPGIPADFGPDRGCSALGHWPVKIRLVPPGAPFLDGADLVVAADCATVACPSFHADYVPGKVVLTGCPKFDGDADYPGRFAELFSQANVRRVIVLRMEVPCCGGLSAMVEEGIRRSGRDIPLSVRTVTRQGEVVGDTL